MNKVLSQKAENKFAAVGNNELGRETGHCKLLEIN